MPSQAAASASKAVKWYQRDVTRLKAGWSCYLLSFCRIHNKGEYASMKLVINECTWDHIAQAELIPVQLLS